MEEAGDGVPRTLLACAVDQWASRNDTPFVALLLASGADVCAVDEASEVAPVHQVWEDKDDAVIALDAASMGVATVHFITKMCRKS